MRFLTLFLFLLPSLAQSYEDFTRLQVEHEHYRSYTREELSSRFGRTQALLPMYACNGRDEFDPFWMPDKNTKKNSLKIQLYKEEGLITYRAGKYFSDKGKEIRDFTNIFLMNLAPALAKLESIPETAKMIRMLEQSPYPLTIKFGGNSFAPKEENGKTYRGIYMGTAISILDHGRMTSENVPFYDIGVGGLIYWNPKSDEFPAEVALGHEMYHALDSVRGLLDMRFVNGENHEFTLVSEYRAVFFENILRKAAGVALRTHYGQDASGPGVLDENGESRFISSPCLK